MHIRDVDRDIIMQQTPESEPYSCMQCGKALSPPQYGAVGAIPPCRDRAQTVATRLMQDVRGCESNQHVSVKVAATLMPR